MKSYLTVIGALVSAAAPCFSQGFVNLGFENATIVIDASRGSPFVYATNAIPHWPAYIGGLEQSDIIYNAIAIDDPAVSIHGTNSSSITPLQGNFSMFLEGGFPFAYATNCA